MCVGTLIEMSLMYTLLIRYVNILSSYIGCGLDYNIGMKTWHEIEILMFLLKLQGDVDANEES